VATDKKAGLSVYGLDGKVRSFVPAVRVNNVALVDLGRSGVIVVASDRNNEAAARLQLYRLDSRRAVLVPLLGSVLAHVRRAAVPPRPCPPPPYAQSTPVLCRLLSQTRSSLRRRTISSHSVP